MYDVMWCEANMLCFALPCLALPHIILCTTILRPLNNTIWAVSYHCSLLTTDNIILFYTISYILYDTILYDSTLLQCRKSRGRAVRCSLSSHATYFTITMTMTIITDYCVQWCICITTTQTHNDISKVVKLED